MKHTYAGELQFRRYADTSAQGQTVTFTLPDRAALESFIGLEGKRFQAVFVQIGDDELPAESAPAEIAKPEPKEPERKRLGALCSWAVMRCKEPDFQRWIAIASFHDPDDMTAQDAKDILCDYCGIKSRTELDTNPEATRIFKEKIMTPYREYLERQNPIHEPETA